MNYNENTYPALSYNLNHAHLAQGSQWVQSIANLFQGKSSMVEGPSREQLLIPSQREIGGWKAERERRILGKELNPVISNHMLPPNNIFSYWPRQWMNLLMSMVLHDFITFQLNDILGRHCRSKLYHCTSGARNMTESLWLLGGKGVIVKTPQLVTLWCWFSLFQRRAVYQENL